MNLAGLVLDIWTILVMGHPKSHRISFDKRSRLKKTFPCIKLNHHQEQWSERMTGAQVPPTSRKMRHLVHHWKTEVQVSRKTSDPRRCCSLRSRFPLSFGVIGLSNLDVRVPAQCHLLSYPIMTVVEVCPSMNLLFNSIARAGVIQRVRVYSENC